MDPVAGIVVGGDRIGGYADSVDSSPRSRGGESWDEPFPASASAAAARLRLMCSFGGRIVPRPTDKSLCYLGGETRMVVVDRHSSMAALSEKLSRSLLGGSPFALKYQIPNEDLDSLISVANDEDLENMIDEHDRILSAAAAPNPNPSGGGGSARSSRLRLFLFPSKPESAPSSIGSLLDDSKSETWFVDALNMSAMGIAGAGGIPRVFSADAASVNCLLGLEDDSSVHSRGGGAAAGDQILRRPDSLGKIHSVPDSPMLETSSSFGSTSSAPSLSNLPPIRVRPEDRPPDPRSGGLEEQFAHMNIAGGVAAAGVAAASDGFKDVAVSAPQIPMQQPLVFMPPPAAATTISPTENPKRGFSSDDEKTEKSEHGGSRRPLPPPSSRPADAPASENSRPIYAIPTIPDPKVDSLFVDSSGQRAAIQAQDSGYSMAAMTPEQLQQLQFHPQQQQQQQQFIHAGHHYIHHPPTGTMLPMHSYFPIAHSIQQSQAAAPPQQVPMYYLPVRPGPAYLGDPAKPMAAAGSISSTMLAQLAGVGGGTRAAAVAAATSAAAPIQPIPRPSPLIQVAAAAGDQSGHPYAGIGYHVMHHQPSQLPPVTMAAAAGYGYEYAASQAAADAVHPPVYFTQAPPYLAANTVAPAAATGIAEAQSPPGDQKQQGRPS